MKYLVVNAHGGGGSESGKFAQWYRHQDPDVGFISELQKNWDELRDAGYHVLTGHRPKSRGDGDVGIVIPKNTAHRIKSEHMERLTVDLNRPIAPDRWYANMEFLRRSLFSLHANAVIQDRETGGWKNWSVSLAWFRAMGEVNAAMREDQKRGLGVVGGGDMNWNRSRGKKRSKPVSRSPQWLAEKRGLEVVTTELMWFFYDPKFFYVNDSKIIKGDSIPTGVGDKHPHDALAIDLRRVQK